MNAAPTRFLRAIDSHPGSDRSVAGWVLTAVSTVLTCVVVWRLSLVLNAPLVLAAAYVVPAVLLTKSLLRAFASFTGVAVAGYVQLAERGLGASIAFLLVGLAICAVVLHVTIVAGHKISDSRRALGAMRLRTRGVRQAIERAGVAVITIGANRTWQSVNEAAWTALGADTAATVALDGRVDLDDEAALTLVHSGSRESWRRLQEEVHASIGIALARPGHTLEPRRVELFDSKGEPHWYHFVVSTGYRGELFYVGYPEGGSAMEHSDREEECVARLEDQVKSLSAPTVAVLADGFIVSSNRAFDEMSRRDLDDEFIFQCKELHGASERDWPALWARVALEPAEVPDLRLAGSRGAAVRRPCSAYVLGVVVLTFGKDTNLAVESLGQVSLT